MYFGTHTRTAKTRLTLKGLAASTALLLCTGLTAANAQVSVLTQHNDNARTGSNPQETLLTPANVKPATFGKLFTRTLDANVNGQVLYVPNVTINGTGTAADGTTHNVIYAYTSNNSNGSACGLWAYDADDAAQSTALWRVTLPISAQWTTAAPVIDAARNIIYVLTKTTSDAGPTYIRAFDITSGKEKPGSPQLIDGTTVFVTGTGDASSGGIVRFNTAQHNVRPALLLVNGAVYIGFAHNSDSFPYHGWIVGYTYDGTKFSAPTVYCTSPNGGLDGIWQSGKGLVADTAGNIYFTTGNGSFSASPNSIVQNASYGMSIVKLSTPNLQVVDYFAPYDELAKSNVDQDVGNCGPLLIPGTNRLFVGGTKFGTSFLLDTTNLGKFKQGTGGTDAALQRLDGNSSSVGQNPITWDAGATSKYVYLWANGNNLVQYQYSTASGQFTSTTPYKSAALGTNSGQMTVTSNGTANGILWAISKANVVYALDPNDVSKTPFWASNTNSARDGLPSTGKWQFPTVVNGKAYIPTGGASIAVYGLLPVTAAGTLTLSGIVPTAGVQTFTFQFRPTDGSATITKTAAIGPSGTFSLTGIPAKQYNVWIKGPTYLATVVPLDATNGNISSLNAVLTSGDADGNNTVDIGDFGILVNAYGGSANVAGSAYDVRADFNLDGTVDIADFGILVNSYGTSGAM